MRRSILSAFVVLAFTACAGSTDANSRVERCTDRMLARAKLDDYSQRQRASIRRYAKTTYCERFERRSWIHDDGTLRIDAHLWAMNSGSCATSRAVEPGRRPKRARRVPCEDLLADDPVLDCALLHLVPRREVQTYLHDLRRRHPVRCDDGTPLDELGVP